MAVWPLTVLGRLPEQPHLIRGHATPITTFSVSSIQDTLIATGAADAHVSNWFFCYQVNTYTYC